MGWFIMRAERSYAKIKENLDMRRELLFMKKYTFSITYVILLTLCLPLTCLYIWLLTVLPIPWDALEAWADSFGRGMLVILLFLLPAGIYWFVVLIFGVLDIIKSFKAYKSGDAAGCVNRMLIHKYGLVVFFAANFFVMFLLYFVMTFGVLIGTRGLAIFAAPVLLPWLIAAVAFTVFATWLAVVPGGVCGIQVIRFTYREKGMGIGMAVLHGILQFMFLADVLDAMYLAVKKWGMGKKSSVVIAVLYVLMLGGIIWGAVKVFG